MEYQGKVRNGVVVLENGSQLPEGTPVRVIPTEEHPTWGDVFEDVSGKAVGLPADMARNHDHYLHGLPKK